MIKVEHLSYSRGGRVLFSDADFTIRPGQHCVLIGVNGAGKSTLIDMILHRDDYLYTGKIIIENIERIGYVNQFSARDKDRKVSVFEFLCEDFRQMQGRMDALCERMENESENEQLMDEYQQCMDLYMAMDGYDHEVNIRKALHTAGLDAIENTRLSSISGGEYKLVQIIRQMLLVSDLLVMDEPDVFLDFENLDGLRALINSYPGTILAASHNRYLLNRCFDKVLQIENREIQEYDGNYIDFCFTQLRMKIAMQELSKKESDFIAYEEAVVERMRDDATKHDSLKKGKTLHARVSYVERWKARHTGEPYVEARMPEIHFVSCSANALKEEYAVKAENYSILFDRVILDRADFTIMPGDKVAIVGANGTGKTTLLYDLWLDKSSKLLSGQHMSCRLLSQFRGETFREVGTVWDLMESIGFEKFTDALRFLSRFCFDEDTMYHEVYSLSGGEKTLLQLALICAGGADMLLLDEPTNHLDLRAQVALEKAIKRFNGTVLMASHDFYTIANCMDYVLYFQKGTVRRMGMRAFRKMIYKEYFSLEYLELEQQKKELELKINSLLDRGRYDKAGPLCDELEEIIDSLHSLKED